MPTLEEAESALSECMFKQIAFCVSGVVLGTGIGLIKRPRTILPMVTGGVAGTTIDWGYGYNVACAKERETYNELAPN